MTYQIAIYSSDEIFSRMIELEFLLLGKSVLRAASAPEDVFADVVVLDLDTAAAPPSEHYRRMIGFTRTPALSADDARRQCSMILHRPFEIRLLRQEVLEDTSLGTDSPMHAPADPREHTHRITLNREKVIATVDGVTVRLSRREYQVLELLLSERGETISRERISEQIGESGANKVDVYMCYLRRKFEAAVGAPLISTVRGRGYRLN